MALFLSGLGFFPQENPPGLQTSIGNISATNCPKYLRVSAFERPWCIFFENKKFCILPQSPLISATIEEGKFWRISKIAKNTIFRFFDPSSNVAEIVEYWGRIHNNFILRKYASRAFQRTISLLLKLKIDWDQLCWSLSKNKFLRKMMFLQKKISSKIAFLMIFSKNLIFRKISTGSISMNIWC